MPNISEIMQFISWFITNEICPHCAPHGSNHFLTKYVVRISSSLFPFPDAIPKYSFGRPQKPKIEFLSPKSKNLRVLIRCAIAEKGDVWDSFRTL